MPGQQQSIGRGSGQSLIVILMQISEASPPSLSTGYGLPTIRSAMETPIPPRS
jgi:hypothetical protein